MHRFIVTFLLILPIILFSIFVRASGSDGSLKQNPEFDKKIEQVAFSRAWLNLLHYERSAFGEYRSLLDGNGFFFAEDGHINPVSELKASLQGMTSSTPRGKLKLHAQCTFPERYRFLKTHFKIAVEDQACPKLEEFMTRFKQADAMSLVFSSAYPNNPSSMFGHTFLRIKTQEKASLNDMGVNFAARVPDDENPFAFMYFGLAGGYFGQWSAQPYYVKVNDYIKVESRDLWEYELNLTPQEIRRILDHLWEIEINSHFNYYFFDENCAFQILALIEAIKPEWDLVRPTYYLIPGESVKQLLNVPGTVTKVNFYPSSYRTLKNNYALLTEDEKHSFHQLVDNIQSPESVKNTYVIDTFLDYLDFLRNEKETQYQNLKSLRDKTLIYRSTLPTPEKRPLKESYFPSTRPDLGHDATEVSFRAGHWRHSLEETSFQDFKFKLSYHDLLNNDAGYSPYGHIEFPGITLRHYNQNNRIDIAAANFLSTTSLFPLHPLSRQLSWKLASGLYTPLSPQCLYCRHVFGEAGGGYTLPLGQGNHIFYLLAHARWEFSSGLPLGHYGGPGLDLGVLLNPSRFYKFKVRAVQQWLFNFETWSSQTKVEASQAFHIRRNFEIRNLNYYTRFNEGPGFDSFTTMLSFNYYYR